MEHLEKQLSLQCVPRNPTPQNVSRNYLIWSGS